MSRTREQCQSELIKFMPWLKGDWEFLNRALKRMDEVWPDKTRRTLVFRLHYGLTGEVPKSLNEIARELRVNESTIRRECTEVRRRLMHPDWRTDERLREHVPNTILHPLNHRRFAEIALSLEKWRCRSTSRRVYLHELEVAAEELSIPLDEILKFYQQIFDSVRRGK